MAKFVAIDFATKRANTFSYL